MSSMGVTYKQLFTDEELLKAFPWQRGPAPCGDHHWRSRAAIINPGTIDGSFSSSFLSARREISGFDL
jgi:hypothetical protein